MEGGGAPPAHISGGDGADPGVPALNVLGFRTPSHYGRTIVAADTRINHARVSDHSTEMRRGNRETQSPE